ncbi:MAG TPA: hypothetical protein VGO60_15290 [Iamia sp.]|jgi:hypothetical protein|nr:hypothetical protein [Iamia sp.]
MRNHTRAALAAAPLSLALLLAACGDDDSADPTTTTTTTTEAATTAPSTEAPPSETAAPPDTAEPTSPPDDGGEAGMPADQEAWAAELVRAWGSGDRERAGQLAEPGVVDQLFAHADPGGDDWEAAGCDGAAGTIYCTFTSASRGERLTTGQPTMPNEATGVIDPVSRATFEPGAEGGTDHLPAGLDQYTSQLVRAWGRGDREVAADYASPAAVDELFGQFDPGGDDWTLAECDEDAGVSRCTFESPSKALQVVLETTVGGPYTGQPQAITGVVIQP